MGTLTWVNKKEAWAAGVPPVHTHFVNSVKVNEATGEEKQLVEISLLRKELQESKALIERWQTVNNQLLAKLKDQGA